MPRSVPPELAHVGTALAPVLTDLPLVSHALTLVAARRGPILTQRAMHAILPVRGILPDVM